MEVKSVLLTEETKEVIKPELEKHTGHNVKIVKYGGHNLALECIDCQEIIMDIEE